MFNHPETGQELKQKRSANKKGAGTADAPLIMVRRLNRAAEDKSANIERWRPDCPSQH